MNDHPTQREVFALHLMAALVARGLHGELAAEAAIRNADILINRLTHPPKNHVTTNPLLEIPDQKTQQPSAEPKPECQGTAKDRQPARISNVPDRQITGNPRSQLLHPPTRKRSVE